MNVVGFFLSLIGMVNFASPAAGVSNDPVHVSYPSLRLVLAASGICPQNRKTRTAYGSDLRRQSPFPPSPESVQAGKKLYHKDAKPTACRLCHGMRGNGNGRLAVNMEPPPRNFTCTRIMKTLPDGQLFWIIKNGSKGTKMPAHKSTLRDREIWQLIHYLRRFAD